MKIYIIAISHKLPKWIEQGINEFIKRFHEWRIEIIELKPSSKKEALERMLQEYDNIQKHIPNKTLCVILDEYGKNDTTQDLAKNISNWQHKYSSICFIIGGADGLDSKIKQQADYSIRLSSMTLPHGFARLLLVEQIYRVWSIINNHPYHRA